MSTRGCFGAMDVMTMGNLGKVIALMVKMRHTSLSSILYLITLLRV